MRPRTFLIWGGLLAAAVTLGGVLTTRPSGALSQTAHEEATPDCPLPAPLADPARNRREHLSGLGVDRWHQAGCRGRGVKIAVLDSGFHGWRDHLGKALPAKVLARSFRKDGDLDAKESQHGILCTEVLHALAPEADILLASWEPSQPEQFLRAVEWAKQQGARIISCSVIMPSWSDGEGGGSIHQALARLLGDGTGRGDLLCFASAGNIAQRHWTGPYHDAGAGWHEWLPGKVDNKIRPWGNERVSIEACWPPGCRYQLQVRDAASGAEIARSSACCLPDRCFAVARFTPEPRRRYQVRLKLTEGPARAFHLVSLGGDLEYATERGSIPFPGDGPEIMAIGAVDGGGQRVTYSSCGPNSPRPKPDFVAPVPFPSLWRDRPFTGTSAAAPQAAGLAALCWSLHPDWTAAQVREALRRWAFDLGSTGHDCETGHGRISLPLLEGP